MGSIARAFRGVGLGFRADKASELEGVLIGAYPGTFQSGTAGLDRQYRIYFGSTS